MKLDKVGGILQITLYISKFKVFQIIYVVSFAPEIIVYGHFFSWISLSYAYC